MRINVGEYVVKATSWGDSITPMYKFRVYKPRRFWCNKLVWVQDLHRREVGTMSRAATEVVACYRREADIWR